MTNAYAYFDCLAICSRLQERLGDTAVAEIHLFAYLSCLLSLYKGNPVSLWEYSFSVTSNGYPYSADLDSELGDLQTNNRIDKKEDYLRLTPSGRGDYELLKGLSVNSDRDVFIEGACSTILALPVGTVRKAICLGPEISAPVKLEQNSLLLSEGSLADIYKQFNAISSVIGIDINEMMVPAVLWLTLISRSEQFAKA